MGFLKRLFMPSEKTPGEILEKRLLAEVPKGCFSFLYFSIGDQDFSINTWFTDFIEITNETARKKERDAVNLRFVKNPDGTIKTTTRMPFGGQFGHSPRECPVMELDAIPLFIRSPKRLSDAPPAIIQYMNDGYDEICAEWKKNISRPKKVKR